MFKKTISFALSLIFTLAAFGAGTLFAGVISAGAVIYDYYIYTPLPGWSEFTAQDLTELYNPGAVAEQVAAPANAPEGVTDVTKFTVTNDHPGQYAGFVNVGSFVTLNLGEINPSDEKINIQWAAKKYPSSGATFSGGYDFIDESGICFWVGQDDGSYPYTVKINLFAVPSKGPSGYYTGDDQVMIDSVEGFCFEAQKSPDADGYVYLDFKTDFMQIDWFWKGDDGNNYTVFNHGYVKRPMPYNALKILSGMTIEFRGASVGTEYYIGDFRTYRDSRIHMDELAEAIDTFNAIDPEAYTEDSYEALTAVYLRAYEMYMDENAVEKYSQRAVDLMARELLAAIGEILPMFPSRAEECELNGFEVWNDGDLDRISDGGLSLDLALVNSDIPVPDYADRALEIVANGDSAFSEPYYGWSCFKSVIDDDGETVAVKNPFGADMSDTAGIRFWIKNPADVVPSAIQLVVGTAGEAEFVAEDCNIGRPTGAGESGYVYASWNSFYDEEGDAEIYEYLDRLDYIGIMFEDFRQQTYYVADLHAFVWSEQNADLSVLKRIISETRAYMTELNEGDYTPRSWYRLNIAIDTAEALMETYGVTQDEADAAGDNILARINRLVPIGLVATREELEHLSGILAAAKSFWRGNYTGRSYIDLRLAIEDAESEIENDISSEVCLELTENLLNAIGKLVPVTHGGIIDTIISVENLTTREFQRMNGHRRPNVDYKLTTASDSLTLPAKALKMTALTDLSSEYTDEHGALQFKLFDEFGKSLDSDVVVNGNKIGYAMGDLTGSSGIRLWIGVNDTRLAKDAYFRFGVSNITEGPLFERHAVNIPFPATGSGWIYIPWEYFEYYDEWTGGVDINPAEIRFYIIRVDGFIPEGLEVYATCIDAYTDPTAGENAVPVISGVAEGQTVDVSEAPLVPTWDVGAALLNGREYVYGTPVTDNGDYTLEVLNGDKKSSVGFTVTGGVAGDAEPVVSGVENGGEYESAVTITWDVGEATLNGEPVENGAAVSEPGDYLLEVVNGTKYVSIRFSIKEKTPPPPEVKRGDMDGDNEITVADALKALRIAAKLVAPTEDDIAIGDIDRDGEVTVADALKILRVAAKLADESSLIKE